MGLSRLFSIVLALALLALVVGALLAGATLVLAFIGPGLGLSFLGTRLRLARAFWTSQGRLPIPGGFRLIDARRIRLAALFQAFAGLGGLLAGLSPTLWLVGPAGGRAAAPTVLAAGLTLLIAGGSIAARLLRGARAVEVLSR